MKLIKSKKGIALLAILAIAAISAVGAYAYFTNSGAGTGSGTVGTSTAFALHGRATPTLYPGQSSPVTLTVDNNGSGNQFLDTIHLVSVDAYPTAADRT